ncbi:hypothetical protein BO99DRAFT_138214 [Aspergillus violaceofuscus CBS 115571]|uniref:Uncharacterized protein n=1 Tax=Aspergillus violaceofuscus (strain CBS 115571) TaxID=1450538 RepID=A0A2V5H5I1_ASPV1|nr:hypothetical protein BO99DRAFT_138214 [Aspergillus violaceofuscus CBS 115571]
MDFIADEDANQWTWEVWIQVDKGVPEPPEPLQLRLKKNEMWKANEQELGAVISLLLSGIDKKNARVPKISRLILGPSSETIPWGRYSDAGIYQLPPEDSSKGLSITVGREMLLGVDDAITKAITEEANDAAVTFRARRIGAQDQPNGRSRAMIARIAKLSAGQLYSQHIFVCFMWAVAKALRGRGPGLRSEPALETLSRKIEFTGLGDFNFARLAITVPLYYYRLLPR